MTTGPSNLPAGGITVLYEDAALLVLDKPAGLLSVPGRGIDKQDCLSERVLRRYPDALIVHRLDMATSGLLVMARSLAAQRLLGKAFEARQVLKRYTAVACGDLRTLAASAGDDEGWNLIDLPLMPDWPNRPLSKVDRERGKPSRTRWRLAADAPAGAAACPPPPATTRVELEPLTGRTHQLRLHLQAIGHPIVGDALYAPAPVAALAPRLLLHATALCFAHPLTGQPLAFGSPAPF